MKERKELKGKVAEMKKLKEVLEVKVTEAETREKEMEDELEVSISNKSTNLNLVSGSFLLVHGVMPL